MENYLKPRQIMTIIIRWWWVILLITSTAIAMGYFFSKNQTPVYEASATVMVGDSIQSTQLSRDDIAAGTAYTLAYAEMTRRQPVLDGAVKALDMDLSWRELKDMVRVHIVENTSMIEIDVTANSPQDAHALAGEIVNQLVLLSQSPENESKNNQFVQEEIEDLQTRIEVGRERLANLRDQVTQIVSSEKLLALKTEIDTLERFVTDWEDTYSRLLEMSSTSSTQNELTIIEEAHVKSRPVSPRLTLNILLSACIGFGLALGVVFLIDKFDDRIRTSESFENQLGLNLLGSVTKMKGREANDKLIGVQNPQYEAALYYKNILDNIGFSEDRDQPIKSVLVTSSRLREGKTTTASNLGIMMAHAGIRTIVVDVDWKNPSQHLLFNISNKQGLMDLLISPDIKTEVLVSSTSVKRLQVLTIGNLPEDPVEVLQPSKIKEILNDLAEISDVVILDAPSTNIAESATLYDLVDGVILVIESGRTRTKSVKQSLANLHFTGGKLLGGILNQSPSPWGIG